MGWESRGGKRYYYRAAKVNGRVVKTYVGTGAVGEAAARLDEIARTGRAEAYAQLVDARRAYIDEHNEMTQLVEKIAELCNRAVAEELEAEGYHLSKGQWRKARKPRAPVDPPAAEQPAARPEPDAPRPFTDPTPAVLDREIEQLAGPDPAARAATRAYFDKVRLALAGPRPRIEVSLLADRAARLWLQTFRLLGEQDPAPDPARARARSRELDAVQRACFCALGVLQRLLDRRAPRPSAHDPPRF